jgi:heme exporter protein D
VATYIMPGTVLAGNYTVTVDVSTALTPTTPQGVSASAAYTVSPTPPVPATGLTVTPSPASPQVTGTPVLFTAQGIGGGPSYQYRFYLDSGAGAAIVQDWSSTNTWTLPSSTVAGNYTVYVWVRTSSAVALDVSSPAIPYVINPTPALPATGLTVTPSPSSPQVTGTAVTFGAQGIGGTGTYQYRFYLDSGAGAVIVQDWSTTASWALPTSTVPGNYTVYVWVRTSTQSAIDFSSPAIHYVINPGPALPATGVTVTATPPSPGAAPVTFQAAGQGGTPTYQYRFYVDFGAGAVVVQDWSATNTWTLPATVAPGNYTLYVWVRTSANVALDASSPAIPYTLQ